MFKMLMNKWVILLKDGALSIKNLIKQSMT